VSEGVGRKGNMLNKVVGGEEKTKRGGVSGAVKVDVEVARNDQVRGGKYRKVVKKRGEISEKIGNG